MSDFQTIKVTLLSWGKEKANEEKFGEFKKAIGHEFVKVTNGSERYNLTEELKDIVGYRDKKDVSDTIKNLAGGKQADPVLAIALYVLAKSESKYHSLVPKFEDHLALFDLRNNEKFLPPEFNWELGPILDSNNQTVPDNEEISNSVPASEITTKQGKTAWVATSVALTALVLAVGTYMYQTLVLDPSLAVAEPQTVPVIDPNTGSIRPLLVPEEDASYANTFLSDRYIYRAAFDERATIYRDEIEDAEKDKNFPLDKLSWLYLHYAQSLSAFDPGESLKYYKEAVALAPNSAPARLGYAFSLLEHGFKRKANEQLRKLDGLTTSRSSDEVAITKLHRASLEYLETYRFTDQVKQLLEEAIAAAENSKNKELKTAIELQVILAHISLGELSTASTRMRVRFADCSEFEVDGFHALLGMCLHTQFFLKSSMGLDEQAYDFERKALAAFVNSGNKLSAITARINLAQQLPFTAGLDATETALEKSLVEAKDAGYLEGQRHALHGLSGFHSFYRQDRAVALNFAKEEVAVARKLPNQINLATALQWAATQALLSKDLDLAIEYLEEAYSIADRYDNQELYLKTTSALAGIFRFNKKDEKRLSFYANKLNTKWAELITDQTSAAALLFYAESSNFDPSNKGGKQTFVKIFERAKVEKDHHTALWALHQLSMPRDDKGTRQKYYEKIFEYKRENGLEIGFYDLILRARNLIWNNNFEEAFKFLNDAERLAVSSDEKRDVSFLMINLLLEKGYRDLENFDNTLKFHYERAKQVKFSELTGFEAPLVLSSISLAAYYFDDYELVASATSEQIRVIEKSKRLLLPDQVNTILSLIFIIEKQDLLDDFKEVYAELEEFGSSISMCVNLEDQFSELIPSALDGEKALDFAKQLAIKCPHLLTSAWEATMFAVRDFSKREISWDFDKLEVIALQAAFRNDEWIGKVRKGIAILSEKTDQICDWCDKFEAAVAANKYLRANPPAKDSTLKEYLNIGSERFQDELDEIEKRSEN